jgi:glycosyltransferase involved in cell wall biosynthesis
VDDTPKIAHETFPFRLCYVRQDNAGDAAARNTGVAQSRADLLVFLDDDILVAPDYLASLMACHTEERPDRSLHKLIVVGTEHLWTKQVFPPINKAILPDSEQEIVPLPFAEVCSNNMSLSREAYGAIGEMEGLAFRGSSIWCDVDFCYRAHKQGFEFLRATRAHCWHRDYTKENLDSVIKRMGEVAFRAVVLFQKHPDLVAHLPMFYDMTPVKWGEDEPVLVGRKLTRHVASSPLALRGLEEIAGILHKHAPTSPLRTRLDKWVVGGHIFNGYRRGLKELGGKRQ